LVELDLDFLPAVRNVRGAKLGSDLARVKIFTDDNGTCDEQALTVSLVTPSGGALRQIAPRSVDPLPFVYQHFILEYLDFIATVRDVRGTECASYLARVKSAIQASPTSPQGLAVLLMTLRNSPIGNRTSACCDPSIRHVLRSCSADPLEAGDSADTLEAGDPSDLVAIPTELPETRGHAAVT
jgi:hypothetical protein